MICCSVKRFFMFVFFSENALYYTPAGPVCRGQVTPIDGREANAHSQKADVGVTAADGRLGAFRFVRCRVQVLTSG